MQDEGGRGTKALEQMKLQDAGGTPARQMQEENTRGCWGEEERGEGGRCQKVLGRRSKNLK